MFSKYGLCCLLAALLCSVSYASIQQPQPVDVGEGENEQQQQHELGLLANHLKGLDLSNLPITLNIYKPPARTPTKGGSGPRPHPNWPPYYPPGWPYYGYPYPGNAFPPHTHAPHTHAPHTHAPSTRPPTVPPTEPPTRPPTRPPTPTLSPIVEALLCRLYPEIFCPKPTAPPTPTPKPKPTIPSEWEDWICNRYPTLCRNTRLMYDPESSDPEFENAMRDLLASGFQGRSSPQPTKRQKFVNAKKQEKDK